LSMVKSLSAIRVPPALVVAPPILAYSEAAGKRG
jgi:hypothetical protein